MEKAVYITGTGVISAIGNGKKQVLDALLKGESGIGPLQFLDTMHRHLPAGEVKLSDEAMCEMLHLDESFQANRTSLLGSLALQEALADAGLTPTDCKDGYLISGTTVGGMDYTERHYLDMLENDDYIHLFRTHECGTTTKAMAAAVGLQDMDSITPSTACSSAANAIIMGCNLIKTGRADIVIAGGSEALSKFHFNGFNTLMILDGERCRPFDDTRAGLNLGEGAAFVVLESERSVQRRGANPLFQVDGYGNACDAYHQTASSDNGEGAYRAMCQALQMAGLQSADIDYVNAHGTGTPNNDLSEGAALQRVFGLQMPAVSSTKSFTGHTTSASGSIETVICLLALQNGFVPANLGWKNQIPGGITPTLGKQNVTLSHVMCNSFGFGGNDSSLILSKVQNAEHAGGTVENATSAAVSASMEGNTASAPKRKVYVRAACAHHPSDDAIDISEFVPKLEARRMCKLLKSAIYTSMTVLKEAGLERPDGIIVGTEYGMLDNSEKFLKQMCAEGEELLKPTLFMQSTHNTIAGTLAIRTSCNGYNITFSNGAESMRDAILDARLQLELGRLDNVLVGYHNELTPTFSDIVMRLYGVEREPGETSIVLLLTTDPEGAIAELDSFDWSIL